MAAVGSCAADDGAERWRSAAQFYCPLATPLRQEERNVENDADIVYKSHRYSSTVESDLTLHSPTLGLIVDGSNWTLAD